MRAILRQWAARLNASYWFLPALLTIGAILLSLVTYSIDLGLGEDWIGGIGWLHGSKPDGARALLSTIAGSMVSVAGTVFAITIAAVVYASGSYGPRLLTNFMTDRGNQLSLGVFIATFVYCLLILRTIRQPDEISAFGTIGDGGFVPDLSLIVAFGLALISVGVLVYFLHHVPDSIRINSVVASIGKHALKEIDERFPDPADGNGLPERCIPDGPVVRAKRTGYLEVLDFSTLGRACEAQGAKVHLRVRPGDFVHPDMALFVVEGSIGEDAEHDLRRAFAIGDSRTPSQDLEYLIDEMVEIALRALSPGINDPFTAITCLHWLAAATAAIAMRDLNRDPDGGRYGERGVYMLHDDFAHFVARGFGSVRASAATSAIGARKFIEALASCAEGRPPADRVAVLREEARQLLAQARLELRGPALAELELRARKFLDGDD